MTRDGGRAFLPRIRESYSGWFLSIEFWEKNKRIQKTKKIIVKKKKNSEEQCMCLGKRGKVISAWNRVCGVLQDSDQIELSLVSLEQLVSTRGGPPCPWHWQLLVTAGGPGVVLLVPGGYRPGALETYRAHNSLHNQELSGQNVSSAQVEKPCFGQSLEGLSSGAD